MKKAILLSAFLAMGIVESHGQGTAGAIVGTVKDPSGAVIADASVTVKNVATNASRKVQTNTAGDYSVPLLPPGEYEVTVEQPGFRSSVSGSIPLEVNQTVRVDINLQVGNQTQQVEVTGAAPLINTD